MIWLAVIVVACWGAVIFYVGSQIQITPKPQAPGIRRDRRRVG